MGNVYASQSNPTSSPNIINAPAPQLETNDSTTEKPAEAKPSGILNESNPGSAEELHRRCKEVFPNYFEGGRLLVQKGLSDYFQISHTITLSNSGPTSTAPPSGYRFGATYVGSKKIGEHEMSPLLIGDIDPSGNLNANMIYHFSQNLKTRLNSQVTKEALQYQITTDYSGKDSNTCLTLAQVNALQNTGLGVVNYIQKVTKNLALGAEFIYNKSLDVPGGQVSSISLIGKYAGKDYLACFNLSPAQIHASYYHKSSDMLELGVEAETSLMSGESNCAVGYSIQVPNAHLTFKGMIDSNWVVGAYLEKRLAPLMPISLNLSAQMHHPSSSIKTGIGLNIAV